MRRSITVSAWRLVSTLKNSCTETGGDVRKLSSSYLRLKQQVSTTYDDAGSVVGQTNPMLIDELPAKAHVWRNRNQLSDIAGDTWNGTASLKIINADENLRLLNLNYINSETFFNFSCYETGQ